MKKVLLLLFVFSLAFVSCTDNTTENEELLEANTQSIDKGGSDIKDGGGSGDPIVDDED